MRHFTQPSRRAPARLGFEKLEPRQVLSAAQLIDLNTEPLGDGPGTAASLGEDVYFQQDGQLWRLPSGGEAEVVVDQHSVSPDGLWPLGDQLLYRSSDGIRSLDPITDQSTRIVPPGNSLPSFTNWGERLVIQFSDQLWLTDGTLAGTKQSLESTRSLFAGEWTELGNELIFSAYAGNLGKELWKIDSDGDAQFIKDIWPDASSSRPDDLIAAGGWVYFLADDGEHGTELWRTDGTEIGSQMVVEIYPGDIHWHGPTELTLLGDYLYYAATNLQHGRELYRTHAVTGATSLVADVRPGTSSTGNALSSNPQGILAFDGAIYFSATDSSGIPTPMKYNPATDGLIDLAPGDSWDNIRWYEAGGQLYILAAARGVNTSHYLDWQVIVSDGTLAGTFAAETPTLAQETTWPAIFNEGPDGLTMSFDQDNEQAIWRVTPSGVTDIGVADTPYSSTKGSRAGDFRLLRFTSSSSPSSGLGELWAVNLTDNSLTELGQIHEDAFFHESDSRVFFNGWDNQAGHALWATDGTPDGTVVMVDLDPRTAGSSLYSGYGVWTLFNDEHYFSLGNNNRKELWASDGTEQGTRPVVHVGSTQGPKDLTVYGDSLYFIAGVPEIIGNVSQLWRVRSDGVAERVEGVTAYRMSVEDEALYLEGAVDGVDGLYRNAGSGFELIHTAYQVNGANGDFTTRPVERDGHVFYYFGNIYREDLYIQNLETGVTTTLASFNTIAWMTPFADGVIFSKRSSSVGDYEMWYSDGTVQGTRPFEEFVPAHDNSSSYFPHFTHNGYHYFRIKTADHGIELWRNNGTPESGQLVADLNPGPDHSYPTSFHLLGDRILFSADDGEHGREWWVIDNPETPPRMLVDINAGVGSGVSTSGALQADGYVYFAGNDSEHGNEVWRTDGTAAGTMLLHDVRPGPASSDPQSYTVANGVLFFHANDGVHGQELWTLPLDTIPTPGDYDGDGLVTQADHAVWRTNYGSVSDLRADGNGDGKVDAADYTVWRDAFQQASGDYSSDYDGDGLVTQADYAFWRTNYGSTSDLRADGNGDGRVDAADYTVWRDAYQESLDGNLTAGPVDATPVAVQQAVASAAQPAASERQNATLAAREGASEASSGDSNGQSLKHGDQAVPMQRNKDESSESLAAESKPLSASFDDDFLLMAAPRRGEADRDAIETPRSRREPGNEQAGQFSPEDAWEADSAFEAYWIERSQRDHHLANVGGRDGSSAWQ